MVLITAILFYSTMVSVAYRLIHTIKYNNYRTVMLTAGGGGGGGGKEGQQQAPQQPAPPPPAAPPPTEDAEVVRQRAEQERRRAAGAKGYGSTDITQGIFSNGDTDVKKPTLLGGS
jgi:hypothetical protein